ncbi:hypothetical protein HNY73_014084 [Argiope bruennichi]|uniref:Uncharacterized protein n=1 Tax=Argiope bruennichi TaxID=94029 RepID=A0A8T0EMY5_ARGBR|nr:hypothetical protein HNY73_014084 [Argiope bruennichi]
MIFRQEETFNVLHVARTDSQCYREYSVEWIMLKKMSPSCPPLMRAFKMHQLYFTNLCIHNHSMTSQRSSGNQKSISSNAKTRRIGVVWNGRLDIQPMFISIPPLEREACVGILEGIYREGRKN